MKLVQNNSESLWRKGVAFLASPFMGGGALAAAGGGGGSKPVALLVTSPYHRRSPHGDSLRSPHGDFRWAPFVLGIVIVGLEAGWIYVYKAGWEVSTGFIVQSAFLAVGLLVVGCLLYREALTWNKIVGVVICLIGLIFLNMKTT